MEDPNLPSSHLLGSVPAASAEDKSYGATAASNSNLQNFPPAGGSYQAPGTPYGVDDQAASSWKGFFSISSYSPYFNVDTDIVVDRLISSVYPTDAFSRKIESNPDLYGPIWISTTLVFMLSALGYSAAYMIRKRSDPTTQWNFDVSYMNWAACVVYGYAVAIPAAFYFLFHYVGTSNPGLVRLWCLWGYSLFIFLPCSLLLVIPFEMLRWIIIILTGAASAWFITINLRSFLPGMDLTILLVSAFILQCVLALAIKILFFT